MSKFIDIEQIWQVTDGGKDIITAYYPNAEERKAFKIRDERTASSSLRKFNNIWFVTDFGSDAKGKNAVEIVQEEEGIGFHEALLYINDRFCGGKLNGSATSNVNKPIVEDVENTTDKTIIEFNENITDHELHFIGKYVTIEIAERYNLRSLKFYITKSGKKITATPDYPILCFDQGTWQKIYQPKADKEYRFFHVGERPKDFIFGLEQLKNDIEGLKEAARLKITKESEGEEIKEDSLEERVKSLVEADLPDVIIASGERDAFNIAAAGYTVLWQNSETAVLSREQYKEIKSCSKGIFNVPDLDDTGLKQGYKLALQYTDIRTIWLPEILKTYKDWRGNACKDATDFFDKFKRANDMFGKMKSVAMSMKFWDKDKKKGFYLNNLAFYQFLHANGYYRIPDKNNKYGYIYIKLKDKVVERIDPDTKGSIKNHVRDFVNIYLEEKFQPTELRNMFYKTRQTDENSLSNLKMYEALDFKTFGKDYQYMFFSDRSWKITAHDIIETNLKDMDKYVWESDIKNRCPRVRKTKKPIFEIAYTKEYIEFSKKASAKEKADYPELDKYDITINETNFIFLKYLVNTSRMYWHKGKDVSETELKEQRLHLINKIYSLGYLAHRYKNPSRPWAVFAVDGRESEFGKSFGGSGKSICYGCLEHINNQFSLNGRDPRKLKNDFLFDGVDEHTYNIIVDDANQYLDFGFFYSFITGKFNVNPKNNKPFTLNFDESPKFAFTSNFALRNIDPSTERRILYTVFSDYYHKKDQDGIYKDNMDPEKEFGKILFDDFTEEEWNLFYNFIALCIQTYLRFDKIEPPMENITKRNLRRAIGEDVLAWANDFFADHNNLNCELLKDELYEQCVAKLPSNKRAFMSIRKFKEAMKNYCQYREWIFNPEEAVNDDQGRIMKTHDGKVKEFFWIRTSIDMPVHVMHDSNNGDTISVPKDTDKLPF